MQPAPVPNLDGRARPAVDALDAELIQETAGRDRFQTVTPLLCIVPLKPSPGTDRHLWMLYGIRTGSRAECSLPIFGNWEGARP